MGPTRSAARVLLALLACAAPAAAHTPHDTATVIAVSPDFANDRLLLAGIQLSDHVLLGRSTDAGRTWQEYGTPLGAGELTRIVFSPDFASDGTVFAASLGVGVLRSDDGGLSWQPANEGLGDLMVRDLAVSPLYPADPRLVAVGPDGAWLSTDGGASWQPSDTGLVDVDLEQVAFDVTAAGTPAVYAAGEVLHRSVDGGLSWVPLHTFAAPVASLEIDPTTAGDPTLGVCFGREGGGVEVSTNGGFAFAPMVVGLDDPFVNDLAFAADGRVFAVTKNGQAFRAPGAGLTWTAVDDGFEPLANQTEDHYKCVVTSPDFLADGRVFVAAFEGLFATEDAGESWSQLETYTMEVNRWILTSPSFAEDGTILLGNYGGAVLVSRDRGRTFGVALEASSGPAAPAPGGGGGGGTAGGGAPPRGGDPQPVPDPTALERAWSSQGTDLGALYSSALAVTPTWADDRTIFYGHVGLWRSTDGGQSWQAAAIPPLVVPRAMATSPDFGNDATVAFGTGAEGLWMSTDGGETWFERGAGLPSTARASHVRFSPAYAADATLFLATKSSGVFRSTDGGASWTDASAGLTSLAVRAFDVSPEFASDQTLYAGTVGEGLFQSTDAGASWTPVPDVASPVVEGVVFSPSLATDGTIFVSTLLDGMFRSTDGGASFAQIGVGLPPDSPRSIAISPDFANDGTVLLATHDWVWQTTDRGQTWQRLSGYTRADDGHPSIVYDGAWDVELASGGQGTTVHVADAPDDVSTFGFLGASVAWFARPGPDAGIAQVELDGRLVELVDLYDPVASPAAPVWEAAFEEPGWHEVRVLVTGTANPASSDVLVRSDGFEFTF